MKHVLWKQEEIKKQLLKQSKLDGIWTEIIDTSEQKEELVETLNTTSILEICNKLFTEWKEYFASLNGDENKIRNKIQSFRNEEQSSLLSFVQTGFSYLLDTSDEEVEKMYHIYFESQTSECYLLWIKTALEAKAFALWFYAAKNNSNSWLNKKFLTLISLYQKLIDTKEKVK